MFATSQHRDAAASNRLVAAGVKRGRSASASIWHRGVRRYAAAAWQDRVLEDETHAAEEEQEAEWWLDRWSPKNIPGFGDWNVAERWRNYRRHVPKGAEAEAAMMRINKRVGHPLPAQPDELYEFYEEKVAEDVTVGKILAKELEEVAVICFPILGSLFASAGVFCSRL